MTKILILGHGRHGKDTAAEILCEKAGLTFTSSSEAALAAIWDSLQHVCKYASKQAAFEDRANKRELWKSLISLYNTPDPTALTRSILAKSDVYVGMRGNEEYQATKHLFDHTLWIDASGRAKGFDPSMDISFHKDEMYMVYNNKGIRELEINIDHFVRAELGINPYEKSIKDLIVDWVDQQCPDRTITNLILNMSLEALPAYMKDQSDAEKLAEIGILLHAITHLAGVDLDAAIRQRMATKQKQIEEGEE